MTDLECPGCHCMTGVMIRLVTVPPGAQVWTCGCGNQHFTLTSDRGYCLNCGVDVSLPPPKP
jgi:hypothetical protein